MRDQFRPKGDVVAVRFGAASEREDRPKTGRRPLSAIVDDIIKNVREMIRAEVRLAKAEAAAEINKLMKCSIKMAAAIVLVLYAVGFLLLGAVAGLALFVPLWQSALFIGLILAGSAALLWWIGRRSFREFRPRLEKTAETLKENLSWIKKPTS
jgi:hypothetical protein